MTIRPFGFAACPVESERPSTSELSVIFSASGTSTVGSFDPWNVNLFENGYQNVFF
jgi:hypothetical protein